MVELDELAARAVAEPPSRPRAVADLKRRAHQRRRRRVAGSLAATLVVFVMGAGAVAWLRYGSAEPGDVTVTGPVDGENRGLWRCDDPLVVFMERDVTDAQLDAMEQLLDGHPHVADWCFMDREASNREFRRVFQRNEAMMQWLDEHPRGVPVSFRVEPAAIDEELERELVALLEQAPGVFGVGPPPHL